MNPMKKENRHLTSVPPPPKGSSMAPGGHGSGRAEMIFKRSPKGRTYLSHQYLTYPFHTTRVFYLDPGWPHLGTLYLTSASGGLFQGDRISLKSHVKSSASAHITTGSATKVHSMERDFASHTAALKVDQNAYLEYIVEPTILFPRSRLETRVNVTVLKGGCAIVGDSFLTHDPTGKSPAPFDELLSEVTIHGPTGDLLVLDRFRLNARRPFLSVPGIVEGFFIQGSIYFIWDGKPPHEMARAMTREMKPLKGIYAGASTLPGDCGAFARILANDTLSLDRAMWRLAAACRKLATGHHMPIRRK